MPTLRRDRGNGWWARVVINGRQIACRMFPPGKKGGPEWRAAKEWEEAKTQEARQAMEAPQTLTGLERLLAWGEAYLSHVERTMSRQTHVEKGTVMKAFFTFCRQEGINSPESVTGPGIYRYLAAVADARGANVANKHRKNLMAAWNWGVDFVDGFPQVVCPARKIRPFPADKKERYVPPEEDVIKVLNAAKGQDLVMLLAMYFTGGRRGEILGLSWEKDIRLDTGKIRLTDNKGGGGAKRSRWLDMHPELIKALMWWQDARPCKVDNVFMQIHCNEHLGKPFTQRRHFMEDLCARAGVKPFGFHAIRHKAAAITFVEGGLNAAQALMGHYRATTTDIYVRSAGLYANQDVILDALGKNRIGQTAATLMDNVTTDEAPQQLYWLQREKETPHEPVTHGAFCTPDPVHNTVH